MSLGGFIKAGLSRFRPAGILSHAPPSAGRTLAITFDDGPDEANTPLILDLLASHNTPATFFVQGQLALNNSSLIRRIHQSGHQVANHGHQHISARRQRTHEVVSNAETCQKTLEDILGIALQRDYRPPYGDMSPTGYLALRRRGYRLVFWSFDSMDSSISSPALLTEHLQAVQVKPGSILLFHDDYAHTLLALPEILRILGGLSCQFVRVSDLRAALT